MLRTLWTAKTGMNANQDKLDAISNNIVNSNTMGYKKLEVGFKDLLSESLDRLGNPINDKDSIIGTGTKTSEWYRDSSQGNLQETLLSTDLAIDGLGYFKIISPDGNEMYTRDGAFSIDGNGKLVDNKGNKVELNFLNGYTENNVVFNKNNFLVDKNGQVYIKEGGNFTEVAEIPVYSAIGDRAFSTHKAEVAKYGIDYMKQLQKHNVISVIKHFPGHGATTKDSHFSIFSNRR